MPIQPDKKDKKKGKKKDKAIKPLNQMPEDYRSLKGILKEVASAPGARPLSLLAPPALPSRGENLGAELDAYR